MSNERIPPHQDCLIQNIEEGESNVRITGTIVSKSPGSIVVNDGTGQITISYDQYTTYDFDLKDTGRFLVGASKLADKISGKLVAFHAMTSEQLSNYQRLVKIEKRYQT